MADSKPEPKPEVCDICRRNRRKYHHSIDSPDQKARCKIACCYYEHKNQQTPKNPKPKVEQYTNIQEKTVPLVPEWFLPPSSKRMKVANNDVTAEFIENQLLKQKQAREAKKKEQMMVRNNIKKVSVLNEQLQLQKGGET